MWGGRGEDVSKPSFENGLGWERRRLAGSFTALWIDCRRSKTSTFGIGIGIGIAIGGRYRA
jgi:hypothetical protein